MSFGEDLAVGLPENGKLVALMHKTVRDVSRQIDSLEYNTAIAFMMEYLNELYRAEIVHKDLVDVLVRLVAPFAPHIAEEMWEMLGHDGGVFNAEWPMHDESKIVFDTFELVAQVNGKVRATMEAPTDLPKEDAIGMAMSHENVQRFIEGKTVRKTIYVPGKLVNIVAK